MEKINKKMVELKNKISEEALDMFMEAVDYSQSGYICDIITEVSDSQINIYNYDLLEWAKDNYTYIEDALDELGTPTDEKGRADFLAMIRQGQYIYYSQEFYNYLDEFILYYAYKQLIDNKIALTTEELEELENNLSYLDNNNTLDDIISEIESIKEKEV